MAQVQALYEDTTVPVREIARRVGVTERTLYKYVEKGNWRRRYACAPRDAANRGRCRQPAEGFAPAKGAGGRFIRREEQGQPFAHGIKALDPAGRAVAAAASAEAERTARRARAEAQAELQVRRHLSVIEGVTLAFATFNDFQRGRAGRGPGPLDGHLMALHVNFVDAALRRWESFVDHEDLGIVAIERP